MSWVDAAKTVRGAWRLVKRGPRTRRPPVDVEPEIRPRPSADVWRAIIDREADKVRRMRAWRSPMHDLVTRSDYEVASEKYGRGDISWKEFEPFKRAHDMERRRG